MENRLFTIAGLFSTDHHFTIAFYTIVCAVVTVAIAKLATRNMRVVPGGLQNLHEATISGMLYMAKDVIGEEKARQYFWLAGSIGFYVFYCNMIGIIPGFEAPTSALDFTLVLALIVFFFYHFEGIRKQGVVHYFAHFMGPIKWLAPLMLPVEIICDPLKYKSIETTVTSTDLSTEYMQLSLFNESRPVIPKITVEQETMLLWKGSTINASAGSHIFPDIRLSAGENTLEAKVSSGNGVITVTYQEASL